MLFELMVVVGIGLVNWFVKKDGLIYLYEVMLGIYCVYGFFLVVFGVVLIGICFCMGLISFDVKVGEIIDLGVVGKVELVKVLSGDLFYLVLIVV